jgi:hypothetical protein
MSNKRSLQITKVSVCTNLLVPRTYSKRACLHMDWLKISSLFLGEQVDCQKNPGVIPRRGEKLPVTPGDSRDLAEVSHHFAADRVPRCQISEKVFLW